MLNSVIMTGRMVADPELRTTQSDIKVTSFRIAVTRNYKVNDEYPSDFFTVVAWRNTAEFVANHFKKGDGLTVQGRAEVRKYTDKDGNNRETVEIIADSVYFGEKKRDTSEQNTAPVPDDFEPIEDVVIITDGECEVSDEFAERFTEAKLKNRLTVTGILLSTDDDCGKSLLPFCDKIYRLGDMSADEIALEVIGKCENENKC